ncbi:MAG TPA: argininosuccinate lyase [Vicinamibacteria bacterium]|nr:argininosuccinate lyase [Vicinamibacteria bacterium]
MKLWGGNYAGGPDPSFQAFDRSFGFDRRLLAEEIAASRAYVGALARCGALVSEEAARLDAGLEQVLSRAQSDPGYLDVDAEDVHSFVETRLTELVGDLAGQAHLGRSRNEQAVTALRLWIRDAIDQIRSRASGLVRALAEKGQAGLDTLMPGYTHTRVAEPISFGHFAAAHAWAIVRDRERLRDARKRVDVLPLGSGALAGTALPLGREAIARDLGFAAVSENALDAVSDRDFAAEFVFACAQLQTHLSRLAEDLIWLSTPEHGFWSLPEAFTSGSSLMPQKKNPDAAELIRGKAARLLGNLVRLLAMMKALPTGYQKDLQEDKEAVFDAADTVASSLQVMTGVVAGLALDPAAMRHAVSEELMAASLAVAIAREGMPFRRAHSLVGSLVAEAEKSGRRLRDVAAERLSSDAPGVAARIDSVLDPSAAVRAKAVRGGTAPDAVRESLDAAVARVSEP